MESEWPELTLEEVSLGIYDCPHSTPMLSDSGPFMVRTQDIRRGFFDTANAAHVSEEVYCERTSRVEPQHGDLLFSREGTYFGDAAEVPKNTRVCLGQRMVLIRPNPKLIRTSYLRIRINSRTFQTIVSQQRDGTVAERLNLPAIRKLPISIPPLTYQDFVISNITCLERKIELNRRMNATLEAMAQALFKSWFVDFDPVIDNALAAGHPIPEPLQERADARAALGDQRQPLPEAIRQQFPNRFVCNEDMGWVPEGWEVVNLTELATKISKGTTPRKEDIPADMLTEGIPFIKVKDITDNGEVILCGLDRIPRSVHEGVLRRSILRHGDILFSIAGTIGRCSIVPKELDDSNTNQAVAFIRPKSTKYTFFIFQHLKSEKVQGIVLSRVIHAVQANFSLTELGLLKLLVPSHEAVESWNKTTQPTLQKIELLRSENNHLTTIRDLLLPKLLSGQLRIPEAEQQVADML